MEDGWWWGHAVGRGRAVSGNRKEKAGGRVQGRHGKPLPAQSVGWRRQTQSRQAGRKGGDLGRASLKAPGEQGRGTGHK